ncbi:MAG: hypothetical protein JW737_07195 [Acidobacteria bacterium]|nr:hypothetical protein [Acidobacteriota bacterium]
MIDQVTWAVVNNVNDLGSSIRIKVNFFKDAIATDPTSALIKLVNPHNTTVQTVTTMTQISVGVYEYNFQTSLTGVAGKYRATVSFVSDSKNLIEDDIFFYVE